MLCDVYKKTPSGWFARARSAFPPPLPSPRKGKEGKRKVRNLPPPPPTFVICMQDSGLWVKRTLLKTKVTLDSTPTPHKSQSSIQPVNIAAQPINKTVPFAGEQWSVGQADHAEDDGDPGEEGERSRGGMSDGPRERPVRRLGYPQVCHPHPDVFAAGVMSCPVTHVYLCVYMCGWGWIYLHSQGAPLEESS